MRRFELPQWLNSVLLASLFAAPRDPGLTSAELHELGRRFGYGRGEIDDAIALCARTRVGDRYQPDMATAIVNLVAFHDEWRDDPRDRKAFAFVWDEFDRLRREAGEAQALIDRDVLVERAVATGISRSHIETAVAGALAAGQIWHEGYLLRFTGSYAHPNAGSSN
jgi:hypothetical protein